MEKDDLIEVRENLKELSKQVQDVGRMIGSARMLGPTKEIEPRFDIAGLNSLSRTLQAHAKTIKIYTKMLKD